MNTYDKTICSSNFLDKVIDHMPNFCIIKGTYKVKKIKKRRLWIWTSFSRIIFKIQLLNKKQNENWDIVI